MKPIWIFEAGTYRSGSTVQYELLRDIVQDAGLGLGIGYHTESRLDKFDNPDDVATLWGDLSHHAKYKHLKDVTFAAPKYVVCKVFLPIFSPDCSIKGKGPSHAVRFHEEGRLRAICTVRNPLDIITSMKRRNDGRREDGRKDEWEFKTHAKARLPKWLKDLEGWIDLGRDVTYWSKYETFTTDLINETRKIAKFLGIELKEGQIRDIGRRYSVSSMNRRAAQMKDRNRKKKREEHEKADPWLPSIPGVVFGSSGQWQQWLSGPEVKMVRESCRKFMERFGYE